MCTGGLPHSAGKLVLLRLSVEKLWMLERRVRSSAQSPTCPRSRLVPSAAYLVTRSFGISPLLNDSHVVHRIGSELLR